MTRLFALPLLCVAAAAVANAEPQRPIRNVLMIVSDDLKASVLGCYGDRFCKTPNIDALANRGVVFERAYCQGTSCAPSRRSFMFSRYPQPRDARPESDPSLVNLGQHFRANGWYSARVGKIYHMRVPGDIIAGTNGLDVASSWTERFNAPGLEAHTPGDYACLNLNVFSQSLRDRQSTKMPHRMFVTVKYDGDGSDQPDHKAASKAIELLRRHKDEPFFMAVGLVRPHYPMVAPRQFFRPYRWQEMPLPPQQTGDLDDIPKMGLAKTISATNPIGKHVDNQKRMWSAYYASVTFMDQQVGRIIQAVNALGLSDNTAVVFISDHGYHLGEHQFWQKSNLHEEVLRVPFILSVPGVPAARSKSIVELVDLFPTLSQLAGLETPPNIHGISLVPLLRDPSATVRRGALSFHNGHSLRSSKWHFMRYTDGAMELYDVEADPDEFTNQASNKQYATVVNELDTLLEQRLQSIRK